MKRALFCIFCFLIHCIFIFSDSISFSGNNLKTILAKGKEKTILTGNAVLTSEDNHIQADTIELYGEDFTFVLCSGKVRVINKKKEIDVSSDRLFYNRKEKMTRFQGNVVMEDKKNETIVKGGYLENWEDDELVIIQTGVRILKKDMVCRAEFAKYYRKEEQLELSGLPRVIWKGDEYRALKIYVNLNNDEIRLEGNVSGAVNWEEDKEKKQDNVDIKGSETQKENNGRDNPTELPK
jgi:lipopolysaccharide export system protein LptA